MWCSDAFVSTHPGSYCNSSTQRLYGWSYGHSTSLTSFPAPTCAILLGPCLNADHDLVHAVYVHRYDERFLWDIFSTPVVTIL